MSIRLIAFRVVDACGVKHHVEGFPLLVRAIELVYSKRDYLHAITKELYPKLAREFNTTAACVERNMRGAIKGAKISKTNSEFIAVAVDFIDYVLLSEKEGATLSV